MAGTLHLLRVDTFEIFNAYRHSTPDGNIPPYAILSHTWRKDGDEITYQDIQPQNLQSTKQREAFAKVQSTSSVTKRQGLEWFWIDTCWYGKAVTGSRTATDSSRASTNQVVQNFQSL